MNANERRERQRKYIKRPEVRERRRERQRKCYREQRAKLTSGYVKYTLGLKLAVPPELIALQRVKLQLMRSLKKKSNP